MGDRQPVSQRKRLAVATVFVCIFMAGFALSASMYSTVLPQMIEHYAINLKQASTISIVNDLGQTAAMIFTLLVVDRLDKGKLLGLMSLCFGVSLFLTGLAPAYLVLLATRLAIGLTGGLVDNLCATYISDLYGDKRSRFISILHTLYAIGSMAGPQFAAWSVARGGWFVCYLVSGAAIAVAAVLYLLVTRLLSPPETAMKAPEEEEKPQGIPYGRMLRNANMRWLCVSSVLFSGLTYLTIWLPTYLDWLDRETYTVEFCALLMTLNYVGMILSRMGLAALSQRMSAIFYVKWSSLLTALLLIAMLWIGTPAVWMVGVFLFGVISGGNYTAKFVLACEEFPRYAATATALSGMFGSLGSILFNAGISAIADAGHYTAALFIPVAALLLAFLIFTFFYREPGKGAR